MAETVRDDRIYPVTRLVLGLVILLLLAAFRDLYLYPQTTAQVFAWNIQPPLTAVYMGAGYLAGAYMFTYAVFGRSWRRVKNSFLPVSAFAGAMLLATLLHYDRFLHNHLAFIVWLIVYIITPVLIPWLWFYNRGADAGAPEPGDKQVPLAIRRVLAPAALAWLLIWIVGFISPALVISMWPWKLTPLTARVMCSWQVLIAVGGLALSQEPRWSAWRYSLQSIALWQILFVIGSLLHRQDYNQAALLNPFFVGSILIVVGIAILYAWMEHGAQRQAAARRPSGTLF